MKNKDLPEVKIVAKRIVEPRVKLSNGYEILQKTVDSIRRVVPDAKMGNPVQQRAGQTPQYGERDSDLIKSLTKKK